MRSWDGAVSNVSGRGLHGLDSIPSKEEMFILDTMPKFDSR